MRGIMYILAPNQTAETYPYSIGMLRRDNPSTSFPRNPPAALLAEWGVYLVQATEPPAHDPITESATEGTPELVEGQWRQTWVITEASAEEIEARQTAMVNMFRAAVQSHIDAIAQSRQYDSGVSLASYRNDPNQAWADEAAAFIAWRSDVWEFVFGWLADVQAGTQDPPESVDALIDAIPAMEWPE